MISESTNDSFQFWQPYYSLNSINVMKSIQSSLDGTKVEIHFH